MRRFTAITITGLFISAGLLAGCGGSSSSSSSRSSTSASNSSSAETTVAQATAATGKRDHGGPRFGAARKHNVTKTRLHATVYNPDAHRRQNSGAGTGAAPLGPPTGPDPCTFVTRPEAEAALHAQLARVLEAPLGPTCIFEVKGQKQSITLAVQTIDVQRHIAKMKNKPTQLSISGHTAYCGTLGTSLLLVPLGPGRALQVVAPCAAAEALAAQALSRIKA